MKKVVVALLCAIVVLCAVSLKNKNYSKTEYMLDTLVTITCHDKKAVDACFDEIERLENLFSCHMKGSDVSKINSAPFGSRTKVSPETLEIIKKANEYKKLTHGDFDISIKPLSDLWDIKGGGYVPRDNEISSALSLLSDVIIEGDEVFLEKEGAQIDLGGIAKGYIGDKVLEILKEQNVKSAIVDLGGNIVTLGKNGKNSWNVGLQNPTAPRGTTFGSIEVSEGSVVTSGGYERYFEKGGKTYHHILDTSTGKNPETDILSITVVSGDGALADALSTACFCMDKEDALNLAEDLQVEMIIYTENGIFKTDKTIINQIQER